MKNPDQIDFGVKSESCHCQEYSKLGISQVNWVVRIIIIRAISADQTTIISASVVIFLR